MLVEEGNDGEIDKIQASLLIEKATSIRRAADEDAYAAQASKNQQEAEKKELEDQRIDGRECDRNTPSRTR